MFEHFTADLPIQPYQSGSSTSSNLATRRPPPLYLSDYQVLLNSNPNVTHPVHQHLSVCLSGRPPICPCLPPSVTSTNVCYFLVFKKNPRESELQIIFFRFDTSPDLPPSLRWISVCIVFLLIHHGKRITKISYKSSGKKIKKYFLD